MLIHYHQLKTETFYFLGGECLFEWWTINNESKSINQYRMPVGSAIKINPETLHRFKGIAPLTKIIEVSTHDDPTDSYRIDESRYNKGRNVGWKKFPLFSL